MTFALAEVTEVRRAVARVAGDAGLSEGDLEDFVLAVHELVTNAVRHGGGAGEVRLTRSANVLTCQVSDRGPGAGDAVVALPGSTVIGQRGLWLARELAGGLVLDSGPDGVRATISVTVRPWPVGA
ncbi:ATP-binding protein [Micromonospora sp. CPCC 205556]|uniref:ATP-binding protein n=1 Tax=Micromonospora sp. CPCC 205556 TaxID=3122398 RepID=UPI002FEFE436